MYRSALNYPEFKDKSNKTAMKCIMFALKKETRLKKSMSVIIFLFFIFSPILSLVLSLVYSQTGNLFILIVPFLLYGMGFWLYLLYEINGRVHEAVKKHLDEFESNQ